MTFRRPLVGDRLHLICADADNNMVAATLTVRFVRVLPCGCHKATTERPGEGPIGYGIGLCFAPQRCLRCGDTYFFDQQLPDGVWLLTDSGSPVRDYRKADIDRLAGSN